MDFSRSEFPTSTQAKGYARNPKPIVTKPKNGATMSVIQVIAKGLDNPVYLTMDGQVGEPLEVNDRVVCRTSSKTLRLIRPPKMLYFDVLREKLKWGER